MHSIRDATQTVSEAHVTHRVWLELRQGRIPDNTQLIQLGHDRHTCFSCASAVLRAGLGGRAWTPCTTALLGGRVRSATTGSTSSRWFVVSLPGRSG